MIERLKHTTPGLRALLLGALTVLALGGCAIKHPVADVNTGKVLFQAKCGTCHTLAHANTTGTVGPNLDDVFLQDRSDGITGSAIEGFIDWWIQYPDSASVMPAKLYTGQKAADVAAYVALVAAVPGKDTGELALAGGVSGTTAADGKAVFTGVGGCSGCHTLAAASATGTVGPDLDTRLRSDCASSASEKIRGTTLEDCIRTAITKPYAFIPSGYAAGVMPANFAKSLTPAEITALINFLSTAAK
jgi:mono/diheme cytochrome c family protein